MTNVIETLPAPQMGARIIEAAFKPRGFHVQYEYSREGRIGLYGNVQTERWRTICWDGYAGREGPREYRTLALARAAARRIIRNNNGG